MVDTDTIGFYKSKDPFYEFSNYYKSPFTIDGDTYQTVEHYYQQAKFCDLKYKQTIREASTPNKARVLATQKIGGGYKWRTDLNPCIQDSLDRGVQLRSDWEDVKVDIMFKGLHAKFTQNKNLCELLKSTGNKHIYENSPRDSFWGVGKDNTGKICWVSY